MSDDGFDIERLAAIVGQVREHVTGIKRAIVDGEEDSTLLELGPDLWELLDELEDILETIDFEELPDAIDVDDLPDSVDIEDIPEGLFDEDETAIELTDVREAVNLRELWDAVDLTALYKETQEVDDAVDDVEEDLTGDEDGLTGDDEDDGDDELFENVVGVGDGASAEIESTLGRELVEETIEEAVEEFRRALLVTHEGLRKLYEVNQRKLGQPGRQPDSLNPAAYSTLPPGPLPDSASTRASTVPRRVKYSGNESPPRRIYGRRFERERRAAGSDADGNETEEAASDE